MHQMTAMKKNKIPTFTDSSFIYFIEAILIFVTNSEYYFQMLEMEIF